MFKKKSELKQSGTSIKSTYPNPFNPETTIEYEISSTGPDIFTELAIYNISGQKVCQLVSEKKTPGTFFVKWNGKDKNGLMVSTGIYFAKLQVNNYISVKKILFVK